MKWLQQLTISEILFRNGLSSTVSDTEPDFSKSANAIKGFLIVLVILGHIHLVQDELWLLYNSIYIFHVAAFLCLPFLLESPPLSKKLIFSRLVRYGVPFFWFFTFATILFYLVYLFPKGVTLLEVLQRWAIGLVTGNSRPLDYASGLKLFWFLPALFTLVVLRALYTSACSLRPYILGMCVLINLMGGEMGSWRYYIPWGAVIAAYIFPMGILTAFLSEWLSHPTRRLERFVFILMAPITLLFAVFTGVKVDLGDQTLYGVLTHPFLWFITNLAMLNAVTAVFLLANLWRQWLQLGWLGGLSLVVYLTHIFFNQAFEIAVIPHLNLSLPLLVALQFFVVLTTAVSASLILMWHPLLKSILFPRNGDELKKAL